MVCSPNRDTDFFNNASGVFPGDTFVPHTYNLSRLHTMKINGFNKRKWFQILKK